MEKSVFIATSLDWLDKANLTVPEGEDCGYASFMSKIDILIMSSNTYEKVLSFGRITDITTTVIPILIGNGISLFGRSVTDIQLEHIKTKAYGCGFVQSSYCESLEVSQLHS